jgi:alpha-tubulin suppressor-like RCC1 family protein
VQAVQISLVFRLAIVGVGSSLALLGTGATQALASPATVPAITSFKVSPSPVRAQGGNVTATAKVRSAQTCTFSIKPKVAGWPVTRHCTSGSAKVTVKFPPNGSSSTKHFTIKLTAKGGGHTATTSKAITQPPLTLTGVKAVVGQGQSYCALLTTGRVDCWGFNDNGQLGIGRTKNSSRPAPVVAASGKGVLTGVASVVSDVFGYGSQYCAVLRTGGVDCWGFNLNGQLGNGTTKSSDKPVAVKGVGGTGLLTGVKAVQPEVYGFCAALTSGGAVCWGLNVEGELGDNNLTGPDTCGATDNPCSTTPVTVVSTSGTGTLSGVASLTGEGETMCALLTTGGVDCWGYGPNGQVGNGDQSGSPFPAVVKGTGGTGTLAGVTSLTGQDNGTNICARLTSGKVDCWGDNTWGELGNGTSGFGTESSVPVAVHGIGTSKQPKAAAVTGIPGLTNCAVLTSGGAGCWGYNGDSTLGNPKTGPTSDVPVKVTGPGGKGALGGIVSLISTEDASQGGGVCTLLTGGGVDCWGDTSAGLSTSPKAVGAFGPGKKQVRVRSLASDQSSSTCVVLTTGGVDCWGGDTTGQLGNGSLNGSLVPGPVLAPA